MRRILLPALLAALAVPGAAAVTVGIQNPDASTPVTLYLHQAHPQVDFPINTQEPAPSYTLDARTGLLTNSLCFSELAQPPAGQSIADQEYHTMFGFAHPDYVDYENMEDGGPRLSPQRGITHDVLLDATVPSAVTVYLATDTGLLGGPADPDGAPLVVEGVVVRATVRADDSISVGDRAYRAGELLLQGESLPARLGGAALTRNAEWSDVDGRNVYGITVPLDAFSPALPARTGFNLQLEVLMDNPHCREEGSYLMPNVVNVYQDAAHRPRWELAIRNPLRIEGLRAAVEDGQVRIAASVESVWGAYDLDEAGPHNGNDTSGLALAVVDASGAVVADLHEEAAAVPRTYVHGAETMPMEVRYTWDPAGQGLRDGLFGLRFTAWNDQRTAKATATAAVDLGRGEAWSAVLGGPELEVEPRPGLAMPGPAPAAALLAVAALAASLRRRLGNA